MTIQKFNSHVSAILCSCSSMHHVWATFKQSTILKWIKWKCRGAHCGIRQYLPFWLQYCTLHPPANTKYTMGLAAVQYQLLYRSEHVGFTSTEKTLEAGIEIASLLSKNSWSAPETCWWHANSTSAVTPSDIAHSYKMRPGFTHFYFDPEEEYLAEPSSAKLPLFLLQAGFYWRTNTLTTTVILCED